MTTTEAGKEEKNIWKVVRVVPENHDVNSVFLEGADEKFSVRRAGQFASIRIPGPDGWSEPHPFTISAAPEDSLLRLTIKKEGAFTSAIPDLKPGTSVKVMGPLGVFCKGIDEKPEIVMIAGGVGVTPFLSVLRHFRNGKARNRVLLFWGNKTLSDAFCRDEIREMTRDLDLTVIHCLSREDDVGGYFDGQAPQLLYEKGRLSADTLKRHGATREAAFYLCGPPPMMESALKELEALGVDPATVEEERFIWKK
ncbi:MAG: FAD/NAD-binding family oxidoreductase [Deltaproteobacteria bacterium HGW-Deltaproteobacteria-19]|jgi:predicted ferric reductase|nr:MAG: FAD/NAD-binding family oxidoreductase [Deltaproteobacteria bacterium HGW-Deltaproteobacteria-19]